MSAFPAVTAMFQKLSSEEYINYEKYSGVTLTKKGERVAIRAAKKYKILRDFLIILGIDEKIADKDACNIEHVVNPKAMRRLAKFVHSSENLKNLCGQGVSKNIMKPDGCLSALPTD